MGNRLQKIQKLFKRPQRAVLPLGAVVFLAGVYFISYRTAPWEVWLPSTMNNDEAIYNREVVSVITHGGPQGYLAIMRIRPTSDATALGGRF